MEVPTGFFLRDAWNPAAWPAARLPQVLPEQAGREFGAPLADEIADLVAQYTRFNSRCCPEQVTPGVSLVAGGVVAIEAAHAMRGGW